MNSRVRFDVFAKRKIKLTIQLLAVISIFLIGEPGTIAFEGDNLEKFNKGKAFIYENVGEGIRSLSNLEKGLSLLEELLSEPNEDIGFHRALADGYRTIALQVYKRNTQGRADFFEKEKAVLELAVELEPNNTDLLRRYALCFRGEERARINRRILTIDENNEEALASLGIHNAITLENPEKGIEYVRKAYDLAQDFGGKQIFGRKLLRILAHSGNTEQYVDFHVQYLADINALRNPDQSKNLKITLEIDTYNVVFQGDMPFTIVLTNTSQQTIVQPNYIEPDLNKFWFSVIPEAGQKSLRLRNSKKVDIDKSIPTTVEIEPGKSFRIETKLSILFPIRTTRLVDDGGYIMFLQYSSPTRGYLYSEPVLFKIRDFINNETAIREDDFTLSVELNRQGKDVSGDVPFSLVFSNNTDKAIKIYDREAFVANFYSFTLRKNGAKFVSIPLPRLGSYSIDFDNLPTITIEPGEQHRFSTKISELSPSLKRLDDGKYGLSVVYSTGFGNEAVFNGRVKSKYIEFNVKNVE